MNEVPEGKPRKRILIVDDDHRVRESISFALQGRYELFHAGRGREALEMFSRGLEVDLVLLECLLVDLLGLEVLRAIRASRPDLPVVTMSLVGDEAIAREAHRLGALHHLRRPFNVLRLIQRIDHLLRPEGGPSPFLPPDYGPPDPDPASAEAPAPSWSLLPPPSPWI